MNIQDLLCDEIKSELEALKGIEVGTDAYKIAVDGITKLTDRAIELDKLDIEHDEKQKNREFEEKHKTQEFDEKVQSRMNDELLKSREFEEKVKTRELEEKYRQLQMSEEQKDRLIKNCLAVASIVVPVMVTIWGTKKSFEFEKEGTITTIMGRGFISKLLPKK